jgi:general secretion pathway protein A
MYLGFYGLRKQPFHITPDPEFLYLSPSHKEALAAIIYGIEERKGFVTITGAVGVGKTTILRSYLDAAEREKLKIIYIFNAKLSFEELLKTIYKELNLPIESNDVVEMVNRLYEVLIVEYKQHNTVVLVVDEAQNMPVDTLESLRMISNLETSQDKLIQIVLVGQPEFEEQLKLDRLRQLKQRLAVRSTIQPLTRDESLDYIKFRLQKAGSPCASVFTGPALKRIVKKAKGIPRVLNILCDNALVTGFGYEKKPVTKRIVGEIIGDFEDSRRTSFRRWWFPAGAAFMVMLTGAVWVFSHQQAVRDRAASIVVPEQKGRDAAVRVARQADQLAARDVPAHPSVEAREADSSRSKSTSTGTAKTVTRGDTLSKLARETYGSSDAEVMRLIRQYNPQIRDPNIIHPGNRILFPSLR